jgi:hypothetical protein
MQLAEDILREEERVRDEQALEQFRADAERLTAEFFARLERERVEDLAAAN